MLLVILRSFSPPLGHSPISEHASPSQTFEKQQTRHPNSSGPPSPTTSTTSNNTGDTNGTRTSSSTVLARPPRRLPQCAPPPLLSPPSPRWCILPLTTVHRLSEYPRRLHPRQTWTLLLFLTWLHRPLMAKNPSSIIAHDVPAPAPTPVPAATLAITLYASPPASRQYQVYLQAL